MYLANIRNNCSLTRFFRRYQLDPGIVDEIRQSTNGGYVLGREDYKQQIEKALKRRVERGRPGRPVKPAFDTTRQRQLEL